MKARNPLNRRSERQTKELVEFGLSLRRAFGLDAAMRYMAETGVVQSVAHSVLEREFGHLRGNGWPDRRAVPALRTWSSLSS